MPHRITVPITLFEITIEYLRPNMRLLMDRGQVVEQLFEGFSPWNVRVDNVEVITEGLQSAQGVKFKMPAKKTSFWFGAGSCKLNRDDMEWEYAEEIVQILDIGYNILHERGGVQKGSFKTSIAMHLQPSTAKYIDLLKALASPRLLALDASPLKATASIVKWDKRRITVDGSNQIAYGIFVRLERDFDGSETYDTIAKQLRIDEQEIFTLLDVEMVQ